MQINTANGGGIGGPLRLDLDGRYSDDPMAEYTEVRTREPEYARLRRFALQTKHLKS